jgi:hypothetical protein
MEQIGDACLTLRGLAADLPPWRIVKAQQATFVTQAENVSCPTSLADLPGAVRSERGAS